MDDNEQIRGLVRRALSRHGYQVDVAASVSQARLMSPGGYDALLVDARVGAERGADLIEELRAADPAVARRCLMVTGGGPAGLPADVACLAKPFRPADLISAVRALPGRDAATPGASSPPQRPAPPGPAADRTRTGDGPGTGGDGPGTGGESAGLGGDGLGTDVDGLGTDGESAGLGADGAGTATAAAPGAGELLRLVARLRAAERAAVADVVHDGPLQDLTAALLTLQLTAGDAPAGLAGRLAEVAGQLGEVATVLRRLVDRDGAAPGLDVSLAGAVRRRAEWLVSGPVTVEVQPAGPTVGRLPAVIPELVELAVFLLAGDGAPSAVAVSVRLTGRGARIQLGLTGNAAGAGAAPGSPRSRRELAQLAAALGGAAHTRSSTDGPQAWITLPIG